VVRGQISFFNRTSALEDCFGAPFLQTQVLGIASIEGESSELSVFSIPITFRVNLKSSESLFYVVLQLLMKNSCSSSSGFDLPSPVYLASSEVKESK